jgi:hypothetical protein
MFTAVFRFAIIPLIGLLFWNCNLSDSGRDLSDRIDTLKTDDPASTGVNHAPTIGLGLNNVTMLEGESKTITLRAKDEDGDPIKFAILNLDSLRALFPDGAKAIEVVTGGDSLVIGFLPGSAKGNYRFRIAVTDTAGGIEVQILTISVGKVNRPPSVSFAAPATGTAFRIKEGRTISLRIVTEDKDGDAVTLQTLSNPPWPRFGQGSYDTKTGTLTFTPSFQCVASGETTFSDLVFRAKDNGSPSETGQIAARISVQDSNSAPKWSTGSLAVQGREGVEMTVDLARYFQGDDEKDGVDFAATNGSVDKSAMRWTFTPGFRDAGQKECVITASDSHKPPLSSKITLSLTIADSVRLVDVAILSPVSGSLSKDTVVPVKWSVGEREQTTETSEVLKIEGVNVIVRSFRDSLGNNGSDSVTVIRDSRPPLAPRITVPARVNTPVPRWTWKSGGEGNGTYRVRLDNPDPAAPMAELFDTVYAPPHHLAEGRHVLYVQEKDDAGNWSAVDSGAVVIDLTPPVVRILSPLPGTWTNQSAIDVKWTLNGLEQGVQNSEPLPNDGVIVIRREAFDEAGNRGADSIVILRRSSAGSAPAVSGSASPTRAPEWTWSSGGQGGKGTYRIGWGAGLWFDTLTTLKYAGPADIPEGPQTLYVSEADSAGNWSSPGSFMITVDRTAPVLQVTGPDAESAIASIDPAITGTSVEANGIASVRWSGAGIGEGEALVAGTAWSIASIVYPPGDVTVAVVATDAAGNAGTPVKVVIHKRPNVLFVRKGFAGKGTSWKDAYGEVWQAVAGRSSASQIWVAEGEYPSASDGSATLVIPANLSVYGGFKTDGSGLSIAERSVADPKTIISCDGPGTGYAVRMVAQKSLLDGFRIAAAGGGLQGDSDNTARNVWILGAGGLAPVDIIPSDHGKPFQLENCRVEGALNADKAAVSVGANSRITLTNCSITGNASTGAGSGGGIWLDQKARITATGLALSGNTVPDSVGAKPMQMRVEDNAVATLEGTVEGGIAGIEIVPGGKVKLNGTDYP